VICGIQADPRKPAIIYGVVWFFRPRSSCTTHLMLFSEHPPIYVLCVTISGGRTEQHVIFAGFLPSHWLMSDFHLPKTFANICDDASCMTISGGRTEQHSIIGFGELAAVD